FLFFFFSSRRRHTRLQGDWSSDVCSSDLTYGRVFLAPHGRPGSVAHVHDLSRMHDGDSAVVAFVFLELCFDLLRVAYQEKFFDRSEERRVGKECRSWWSS